MKKMLLMAIVAMMSLSTNAQQVDPIYDIVEVMALYEGGDEALFKLLCDNMQYPQDAQKQKIEGKVRVQLIIEKDGSVSDWKVVKSVSPSLDAEAIRVAKLLKKWKPAKNKGQAVRSRFTIPVTFRLN